jgi:hypothetical protein
MLHPQGAMGIEWKLDLQTSNFHSPGMMQHLQFATHWSQWVRTEGKTQARASVDSVA